MTQPKKRVYELARELNMTNKSLLERISSLDLGLNSHMSTLDEDTEHQIRQFIQGVMEPSLVEKRVKPTVIRRRRKKVKPEPAEEPAETEAPEEDAEAAKTEEAAPAAADDTTETAPETDAEPQPDAETIEAPETAAETEPEADEEPEAEPVAEPQEVPEESETPEPAEEEAPPAPEPAAPQVEESAAAKPEAAEAVPEHKPAPKPKKKEHTAKIIKLPDKPVPPTPRAPAAAGQRPGPGALRQVPTPPPIVPAGEERGKRKGKKKGGRGDSPDQDLRYGKKKSAFKRKSVIEGADLYSSRQRGRKGRKGAKGKIAATGQKTQITTAKAIKRRIKIDETIVLAELAKRMGIKAADMIAKLMGMGVMATVNQTIDFETATLVAAEFGYEIEKASFEEEEILQVTQDEDPDKLAPRPPVVTIMGHVDHGKTSLLDVIRKSSVTSGEAGGITQHIGAYLVTTDKGDIAFLDTPGHEAFSAMRNRGAQVTDIVILVVAADDGVMPQTIEAINHSKAAEVPIIVAVNKMDKAEADPDRVTRQLSEIGIVPEDWGGENIFVKVSAKAQTGLDELLEMILLQAEILELKANPDKLAVGHVVEAKLDSGRGPVATVLVKEGTLRTGDPVVCGVHHGKVRAMLDDLGRNVEKAGPSMPVEIIGLSGVPMAGDEMVAVKDERDAKQVSQHRTQKRRSKDLAKTSRLSLDKLFEKMQEGELQDLNLIIKTDVDGSMEAIRDSVLKLSNEEVNINIIHAATGTITESDISLAAVSDAIIIGFNVRANAKVHEMANEEHVDIRYHNIIYNVIQEIKDAIVGLMKSTFEERLIGRADVRETFHVPKVGTIAGCYVTDGKIERGRQTRLLRDGIVIYDGKSVSLRRYKDDVKEVQSGYECGIGLENYNDIKVGDVIENYYMEEIRPEMD
ncbi:MAG: translation initiation factor IF-2 [Desulfobacteraceae bacterium]